MALQRLVGHAGDIFKLQALETAAVYHTHTHTNETNKPKKFITDLQAKLCIIIFMK